jgi:hypothetical protein
MGHLELAGFRVNKQIVMEHGLESKLFAKFSKVFSGHYHTRSTDGKVFYLGNPYEMFWADVQDKRGFTIFDTETLEHSHVRNPNRLFYNIYYDDLDYQMFDTREYENKIVKLIVNKKSDLKKFDKFLDKLYSSNIFEIKIVENIHISEPENSEVLDSEDTLGILDTYIEESDVLLDKNLIKTMIKDIYQEACEIT